MSALRFLLGALALHLLLCLGYVQLVASQHEAWVRDRAFLERADDVHIAIVGDSHPRLAVVPEKLPGSVQLATRGEDYLKNHFRLRWLLARRGQGIDAVVLGFDASSFSPTRVDDFRPEAVWGRYVPYFALGQVLDRPTEAVGLWGKAHLAPYAGEAETLSMWVQGSRFFRQVEDGSAPGVQLGAQWGDTVAARHYPEGAEPSPILADHLRAMVAELKAHGIRVFLVEFPVTPEYTEAVEARSNSRAIRDALLAELVEPGVVDHLDYESLGADKPQMFGDGDHLNRKGALHFTIKLRNDLAAHGVGTPDPRFGKP